MVDYSRRPGKLPFLAGLAAAVLPAATNLSTAALPDAPTHENPSAVDKKAESAKRVKVIGNGLAQVYWDDSSSVATVGVATGCANGLATAAANLDALGFEVRFIGRQDQLQTTGSFYEESGLMIRRPDGRLVGSVVSSSGALLWSMSPIDVPLASDRSKMVTIEPDSPLNFVAQIARLNGVDAVLEKSARDQDRLLIPSANTRLYSLFAAVTPDGVVFPNPMNLDKPTVISKDSARFNFATSVARAGHGLYSMDDGGTLNTYRRTKDGEWEPTGELVNGKFDANTSDLAGATGVLMGAQMRQLELDPKWITQIGLGAKPGTVLGLAK